MSLCVRYGRLVGGRWGGGWGGNAFDGTPAQQQANCFDTLPLLLLSSSVLSLNSSPCEFKACSFSITSRLNTQSGHAGFTRIMWREFHSRRV